VDAAALAEIAVMDDGDRYPIEQTGALIDAADHASTPLPPSAARPTPVVAARGREVRAPLGILAGARSGDKGGDANVGVWVRDPEHLPWLLATLGTVDQVRALLPEAAGLDIEVHPLPNLLAVNLLVRGLLGDGVASSTRPDPQAKGLGEYLRSRCVTMPAAWRDAADGRVAR
jgi:hypothetical protein